MSLGFIFIDDDTHMHTLYQALMKKWPEASPSRMYFALTIQEAKKIFLENTIDIAFLDISIGAEERAGLLFLEELSSQGIGTDFILASSNRSFEAAQQAMRLGALDFLSKGFDEFEFLRVLERVAGIHKLKKQLRLANKMAKSEGARFRLVGESDEIKNLNEQISKLAAKDISVLIEAETGSGKELVARNLHLQSKNPSAPFVAVDCATIPHSMSEGFLFGHEKGAFTGAESVQEGIFEQANGGTLFLDELSSLSLEMQLKFLRVLQEKEVRRIGGKKTIPVNFRLICASNQKLDILVKNGQFKEDLFYRLSVITLRIPPLRERIEDIKYLVPFFLPERILSDEVLQMFLKYSWPGNVRELRNVLFGMLALSDDTEELLVKHIPATTLKCLVEPDLLSVKYQGAKNEQEKEFLQKAYAASNGNISKMARLLDLDRSHLHGKLKRLGIHLSKR